MDAPNYLKTAEKKKILSNIESLGLLSAAEKAGLSLSKVCIMQCFSPRCHTLSGLLNLRTGVLENWLLDTSFGSRDG